MQKTNHHMSQDEILEFGGMPSTCPLPQNRLWVLWELTEEHESMVHEKSAAVWRLHVGKTTATQLELWIHIVQIWLLHVKCKMECTPATHIAQRITVTPSNLLLTLLSYCKKK